MVTFNTKNGKTVQEEDRVELTLSHGAAEKKVTGVVRAFKPNTEHIIALEAKIDELRRDNYLRWEVVSDDNVAVGFVPEHVLTSD